MEEEEEEKSGRVWGDMDDDGRGAWVIRTSAEKRATVTRTPLPGILAREAVWPRSGNRDQFDADLTTLNPLSEDGISRERGPTSQRV